MRRIIFSSIFILSLQLVTAASLRAQTAFEAILGEQNQYTDVVVDQVVTVDTLKLHDGQKIRLIGIKAPDLPEKVKIERETAGEMGFVMSRAVGEIDPTETIEQEALDFVRDLLEGKHVRLEFDHERKSEDHKTLAYVYLLKNDTFVNAEILRQGYASLSVRPPNTKHEDVLREAYQEARQERRGLQGQ